MAVSAAVATEPEQVHCCEPRDGVIALMFSLRFMAVSHSFALIVQWNGVLVLRLMLSVPRMKSYETIQTLFRATVLLDELWLTPPNLFK